MWEFDYIFNDVFFHDIGVMLQLRSLEGDLAGHLPSVPHSTPMYSRQSHYRSCTDTDRSVHGHGHHGERIGLVTQISVVGVRFPSSLTFYPENPVYVQITWWHIIY